MSKGIQETKQKKNQEILNETKFKDQETYNLASNRGLLSSLSIIK